MKELLDAYEKRKYIIKQRIKDFEKLTNETYPRMFEELCFCICTPQSKALLADQAIKRLSKNGALLKGGPDKIRVCLSGVRFPNNKSRFIFEARGFDLMKALKEKDDIKVRDEIVKHVKGIGLKEASHFLRNIGRAEKLAILDVHILRNMERLGVIKKIPKTLTKKTYFDVEKKMLSFADDVRIPLRELDLLFWSLGTGHVFK